MSCNQTLSALEPELTAQHASPQSQPLARTALVIAVLVGVVHTVIRVWVILGPGMGGPSEADERRFHLPVIHTFVESWPRVDLSDYAAASTPGHHVVLAAFQRYVTASPEVLRIVSGLPMTVLLAVLTWWCVRRAGALVGTLLVLPLACSTHTVSFSTLVVPESTSWMLVALPLCMALRERFDKRTMLIAGALLLLSVFVRQITLWLAAPLWIAAWMRFDDENEARMRLPLDRWRARCASTSFMIGCTLPALVLLGVFAWLWGGLVPPGFQSALAASGRDGAIVNEGLSPAAPAFIFALIGIVGTVLVPLQWQALARSKGRCGRWALFGAAVAALCAIVPETSYSIEDGRWGGIWNAGLHVPDVGGRSVVILVLAMFGGAYTGAALWALAGARTRWVVLSALVAVMAAHIAGAQLFQRYIEPFALILAAMVCAHVLDRYNARVRWWMLIPLVLLSLAQAGLTVSRIGG